MSNSNKGKILHKTYDELPLLILLDEYTKLDVNQLLADFELLEESTPLVGNRPED